MKNESTSRHKNTLQVRLDAGLHQRLKMISVALVRPMSAVLGDVLENFLEYMEDGGSLENFYRLWGLVKDNDFEEFSNTVKRDQT